MAPYDVSYWKERFEHSQWQLPLTQRIIGDDGLYAYNGYALFNGTSPYTIVSQVPPLGKYILGASIIFLHNASYPAFIFSIGTLILFYLIAKKMFSSSRKAILSTAFFSLDPFFFTQLWPWMLDIFQLFLLLANIYFFILFCELPNSRRRSIALGISGITLALFSQIKVPILLPLLLIIELGYLFYLRKLKDAFLFVFIFICAFLFSNIQFFLEGKNFLEFLKFQKYVFVFYGQSKVMSSNYAIWQTLFFGNVPQVATGTLTAVREWWPVWSVIGVVSIVQSFFYFKSKNVQYFWKIISIFLCGSFIIFSFVPFYPRYLILLIPFLYLIFFQKVFSSISDKKNYLLLPLLFFGLCYTFYYLQPNPKDTLSTFYHSFENRYFKDIYVENLSEISKKKIDAVKFNEVIQSVLSNTEMGSISIQEKSQNIEPFSNSGKALIHISYKTRRLGSFGEDKVVHLRKENDKWKIDWDWNLIFDKFDVEDKINATYISGKRGAIFSSDGKKIVEDKNGYLVTVNPEKIDRSSEESMLAFLSEISGQEKVRIQAAYLDNPMKGEYVPVSTFFIDLSEEEKLKLSQMKGIKLLFYPNRIAYDTTGGTIQNGFYYECCSRIYSSHNYIGISGPEKEYENLLRGEDGGKIVLVDAFGNEKRVLIEKKEKNGKDIIN